jgi:hypothetical protein
MAETPHIANGVPPVALVSILTLSSMCLSSCTSHGAGYGSILCVVYALVASPPGCLMLQVPATARHGQAQGVAPAAQLEHCHFTGCSGRHPVIPSCIHSVFRLICTVSADSSKDHAGCPSGNFAH